MKLEPISILTIDGVPHVVKELPETVQQLVAIYNDWRQEESDAKMEMLKCQAAIRDLSNEISSIIRAQAQEKQQSSTPTPSDAA